MAVHIIATDCIIDQPLSSQENTLLSQRTFDEVSGGAYRGLLFAILFNAFLAVIGVSLWLLLRK